MANIWMLLNSILGTVVPLGFAVLIWKRQWTLTGLIIALSCFLVSWIHITTPLRMLFETDAITNLVSFGAVTFKPGAGWFVAAVLATLVPLHAGISAMAKPLRWGFVSTSLTSIYTLTSLAAWTVSGWVSLNKLPTLGTDQATLPVWIGFPLVLLVFVPFVVAIPWSLQRRADLAKGTTGAIMAQFWVSLSSAIVLLSIVVAPVIWGIAADTPLSGDAASRLRLAIAATSGLVLATALAIMMRFRKTFLIPAIAIIETAKDDRPVADADGINQLWMPLARQIDESRSIEQSYRIELEEARAQLSAFFEHVPVNMSLHGLDGRYVLGSGQVAKSYGISEEELRARDMQSLAGHWPKFGQLAAATIKVVTTGETQRIVTPFKSGDADEHVYDVVIFPIHSADGRIVQIGSLGIDITAQDKLLAELETRNSSMQAFFDNAPLLMYTSDLDDIVTTISDWPVRETGSDEFNPARALGRPVSESNSPAWTEFAERSFQAAVERSETTTAEIPLHYAGKERQTLSVRFPIKDSTGKVVQIGGYILDISAQKESEAALAEREAQLTSFFNHAPVSIGIGGVDGRFIMTNPAVAEAYGCSHEELMALTPEESISAWPDTKAMAAAMLAVMKGGKAQRLVTPFQPHPDRPEKLFDVTIFPIAGPDGMVAQIGTLGIDVTDQVQAQKELDGSRATLQAFFENIPAMTFIISPDRRYVTSNSYAVEHYGFDFLSPENLIGQPDITGTPEAWHPIIEEAHRKVMEEGKTHTAEPTFDMPDGSLHLLVSRFPIRNTVGEITHVGGLIFDRTAERKAAEAVVSARESLHQSEKLAALGQLLAGVAHELNNPLTVVVGRSAILEEKLKETPHGKAIADLREAADRCNRIVRTFLAMARQSAPRRAVVQVNDAIEAALDMTAYGLRSSGIDLVRKLDAHLPEVEADEDQLVQVFTNLLINARHALEEHRPEGGKVTIATRVKADKLLVEIADNGAGVPAEIVSRIFEPFFTTKAVGDGTGMGLAMSKGMIEEHGGRLLCSNAPNGGAVFTVELPIAVAAESAKPESALEPVQAKGRGRVLVVDDEPSIRGLLVEILEGIELDCTECTDGAAALGLLANEQFDLIFCDVRMPVMDGVRFRQRLAETHPEMLDRLVFISGDVLQRGQSRRAEIADHPFVEKPFNPAEVRQLALSLLGGEGDKS